MPLTPDQIRALQPSELPLVASELIGDNAQGIADNAAAIPTNITDLADVPALGVSGTVLTVDGAGTGLEWAAPAGGGFAWRPDDWRADPSAKGIGTATPLLLGDYPDLSVADGGVALAVPPALNGAGAIVLEPTPGAGTNTTPAGVPLASVGAGDYTVLVSLSHLFDGADANASVYWEMGIAGFVGTDTAADAWDGVVVGRSNQTAATSGIARWQDSGAPGRGNAFASPIVSYANDVAGDVILGLTRVGNILTAWKGDGRSMERQWAVNQGAAPAAVVALLCSCGSAAPASLKVAFGNVLVLSDGAPGAGTIPGWA